MGAIMSQIRDSGTCGNRKSLDLAQSETGEKVEKSAPACGRLAS
jgi:hypothetical protein